MEMIENLLELLAVAGLDSLEDLTPVHIQQRVGGTLVSNHDEMHPPLGVGCLLQESTIPGGWRSEWARADVHHW